MDQKTQKKAQKLLKSGNYSVLWSNSKGRFFTTEEKAKRSLKADEKLTKHVLPTKTKEQLKTE